MLDGGAHIYDAYECAGGKWISIGSIEPQFYPLLLEKGKIADPDFQNQMGRENWPQLNAKIADIFKSKTRDEWCELMEGSDVCFAPVLSLDEAPEHPHNASRDALIEIDGLMQPTPAPRFSRSLTDRPEPPPKAGENTDQILAA